MFFKIQSKYKKKEKFILSKEKTAELLCNIYHYILRWIWANFFLDKEKTTDNRILVLQKEGENPMDGTCGQRGKNNQTDGIFRIVNEKKGLGDFDTQRTYWIHEGQIETASNVTYDFS